jgi:antitoxin component of RelBE/YafQ-DinJ toxin-antitoxin module
MCAACAKLCPLRKRRTVTITIDPQVFAKAQALAESRGLSASRMIELFFRDAIRTYEAEHGELKVETRDETR